MMSSWALSTLVACALIHASVATTCTTSTLETCEATSFVTSTCSSGNCGCVTGYTAIDSGCAPTNEPALPVPTVTSTNADGASQSGEVLDGQTITLTCSHTTFLTTESITYAWLNRGVAIAPATSQMYTTAAVTASTSDTYTCTYTVGSATSAVSASFTVTGFAATGMVTQQPVITGFPSSVVDGRSYTLTCGNIPVSNNLVSTFTVNSAPEASSFTYMLTVTSGGSMSGISITCALTSSDGYSFATARSAAVTTPAATDLLSVAPITAASVVVRPPMPLVGGYMIIRCPVEVTSLSTVTYSWTFNGITITGQRDSAIQINGLVDASHGGGNSYVCTASSGVDYMASGTTSVTVLAVASAATPTISGTVSRYGVGNSYTLTCGTDSLTPGMTFAWMQGTTSIGTSQTQTITATTTSTSYTCATTFGGSTRTSAAVAVVGVNVKSVTVSGPTAPVQGVSATYTCVTSLGASSGSVVYSWTRDGTVISSQTSATYTIASVAAANDGMLRCIATVGTEVNTAPAITVASIAATALAAPTIPDPSTPVHVGGTYTLICFSNSAVPSATYVWNFTPTTGSASQIATTQTYTISSAATSNSGSYSCSITISSMTMTVATPRSITVGSAGLECSNVTPCLADFSLYTGNCIGGRCECQSTATLGADGCTASGAASLAGSLFLILLTYMASRVSSAGI